VNNLLKILSDPNHVIKAKLPVNARGNSLTKKYQTSKAKPEQYSSSFVQKYLRVSEKWHYKSLSKQRPQKLQHD